MSESQSLTDFQPRAYKMMIFNLETLLRNEIKLETIIKLDASTLISKRHFEVENIAFLFGNVILNLETSWYWGFQVQNNVSKFLFSLWLLKIISDRG